jgi:DNA polymerase III delta prime subunit
MASEKTYVEPKKLSVQINFLKAMNQLYEACLKIGTESVNDWSTRAFNKSVINREIYNQVKELMNLRHLINNSKDKITVSESQVSSVYAIVRVVYESKNKLLQERNVPTLPKGSFRKRAT